jgi:RNA polymerase sigma factor (sigma-70 family)
MYRSGSPREMKPAELEQARLGFNQYLRRKRFSPQFVARHGEELFATAMLEYSRKLAEGVEIENPPGWLITCAWQRTKSLLEAEDRTPRVVSTERVPSLADEREHSPEDAALEEDRFRKVQHAVAQLSEDERRLLELSYFEGLAVREVARVLDWHPSKAQRCHEAAQKHLHKLLGVESLDELIVEIGLAAYVSFIGAGYVGLHLPTGTFEAAIEAVGRGTSAAWARAQDLARRLPIGGGAESSAGAALQGGAGRVAGACATAAVAACLAASGVVGPGVGGILNGGSSAHAHRPKPPDRVALAPRRAPIAPQPHSTSRPVPEPHHSPSSGGGQRDAKNMSASASAQRTRQATRASASQFAVESEVVPEEASSPPPPAESSAPSSPTASASSPTPTQISNEQFGP